jgi:hypothetical protein
MDLDRLKNEEKVAVGAGIVLFISLFLNWYGVSAAGAISDQAKQAAQAAGISIPDFSVDVTGWQAFSYTDLWIFLLFALTVGAFALRATKNEERSPLPLSGIAAGLSIWVALLVIYRVVINKPGPGGSGIGTDFGAWIGLVAAIVLAVAWTRAAILEGSLNELRDKAQDMAANRGGSGSAAATAPATPAPAAPAPEAPAPAPAAGPPPAAAPPVPPVPPGPPQPPGA